MMKIVSIYLLMISLASAQSEKGWDSPIFKDLMGEETGDASLPAGYGVKYVKLTGGINGKSSDFSHRYIFTFPNNVSTLADAQIKVIEDTIIPQHKNKFASQSCLQAVTLIGHASPTVSGDNLQLSQERASNIAKQITEKLKVNLSPRGDSDKFPLDANFNIVDKKNPKSTISMDNSRRVEILIPGDISAHLSNLAVKFNSWSSDLRWFNGANFVNPAFTGEGDYAQDNFEYLNNLAYVLRGCNNVKKVELKGFAVTSLKEWLSRGFKKKVGTADEEVEINSKICSSNIFNPDSVGVAPQQECLDFFGISSADQLGNKKILLKTPRGVLNLAQSNLPAADLAFLFKYSVVHSHLYFTEAGKAYRVIYNNKLLTRDMCRNGNCVMYNDSKLGLTAEEKQIYTPPFNLAKLAQARALAVSKYLKKIGAFAQNPQIITSGETQMSGNGNRMRVEIKLD